MESNASAAPSHRPNPAGNLPSDHFKTTDSRVRSDKLEALELQCMDRDAAKVARHLAQARQLCAKYNRLFPFAQPGPDTPKDCPLYVSGKAFEGRLNEFDAIFEDACYRLGEAERSLQDEYRRFRNLARNQYWWYEQADPFYELKDLLSRIDISEDVERYRDFCERAIRNAFEKGGATDDEKSHIMHDTFPKKVHPVLAKAIHLIQPIIDLGRDRDTFHLLMVLMSQLRHRQLSKRSLSFPRVDDNLGKLQYLMRKLIGSFAARVRSPPRTRPPILSANLHIDVGLELEHGIWYYLGKLGSDRDQYWDFARSADELRNVYNDELINCIASAKEDLQGDSFEFYAKICCHCRFYDILNWMQIKAWSEIRTKVFLLFGKRLPTEIVDHIFDFALAAEGITVKPNLVMPDTVTSEFSDAVVLSAPDPVMFCVKAEYRCWYMEPAPNDYESAVERMKRRGWM